MPSTSGYMVAAGFASALLFILLWWLLDTAGDDTPWLPAGLGAGMVMLVAVAAREAFMRRAWARYTHQLELEMGGEPPRSPRTASMRRGGMSVRASAAALRSLKQRLAETEAGGASPEAHLEAYQLCEQYLTNTEETLRSNRTAPEVRVALRAGQERVRELQKHHLLAWARGEATRLTSEAQRRIRLSDKIETAQKAIGVIEEALRLYPGESELRASAVAVRDFVASVKVAHWVELAERSAFRGRYRRAIARYQDALFYLSRTEMGEHARAEAITRIEHEIGLMRARLAAGDSTAKKKTSTDYPPPHGTKPGRPPQSPAAAWTDVEGEQASGND